MLCTSLDSNIFIIDTSISLLLKHFLLSLRIQETNFSQLYLKNCNFVEQAPACVLSWTLQSWPPHLMGQSFFILVIFTSFSSNHISHIIHYDHLLWLQSNHRVLFWIQFIKRNKNIWSRFIINKLHPALLNLVDVQTV